MIQDKTTAEWYRRAQQIPPPYWAHGGDFETVGYALETVFTDLDTIEAGLWGGDLLPRAMLALNRIIEKFKELERAKEEE